MYIIGPVEEPDQDTMSDIALINEIKSLKSKKELKSLEDEEPVSLTNITKEIKDKKKKKKAEKKKKKESKKKSENTEDDDIKLIDIESFIVDNLTEEGIDTQIVDTQKRGYGKLKRSKNEYKKEFSEELTLLYNLLSEVDSFGKDLEKDFKAAKGTKVR